LRDSRPDRVIFRVGVRIIARIDDGLVLSHSR
jgi:hypothetical protein